MTDSIYNNAGMPSGQGAAPEIPIEQRNCCICGAMLLDGKCMSCGHQQCPKCDPYVKPPSIAALTLERDTLKAENAALRAKVVRMSAPIRDAEYIKYVHLMMHQGRSRLAVGLRDIETLLSARASTPHPINDDEQRRKDAGWNDRPKARCVCGEMIAWYSGEWLHVDSRSGSCADGRLASPAHFLVGTPPA